MGKFDFTRSRSGEPAQIFPLIPGLTSKTSGTYSDVSGLCCNEDGSLTVTYQGGTTETINFVEGNQFGFTQPAEVTVNGGNFHFV
jgi:hypothetical protein